MDEVRAKASSAPPLPPSPLAEGKPTVAEGDVVLPWMTVLLGTTNNGQSSSSPR